MAESDIHLPKKVFKAEKMSYIDDEKKQSKRKTKKERNFGVSALITRVLCERMCAIVYEFASVRER